MVNVKPVLHFYKLLAGKSIKRNAPSSALAKKIKGALDGVEDKDGDSIVSDTAAYHEKHSEESARAPVHGS